MSAPKYLKRHTMYTESDYTYLNGKGYSNREIERIWDRDAGLNKEPLTHKAAPDLVGYLNS